MTNHGISTLYGGISDGGIGVNHGTVTQYVVDTTAPPEERVHTARRCLQAGLRERAGQLLDEAFEQDYETDGARYLRVLAVVSRRTPEELTDEDWLRLRELLGASAAPGGPVAALDPDGFRTAIRTVSTLLAAAVGAGAVRSADASPSGAPGTVNGAAAPGTDTGVLLSALPPERRAEIEDHLRYVVRSIERDADDTAEEAAVRERRFAFRRTERVPVFFTADPLPPRPPDAGDGTTWLPNAASGWVATALAFIGGLATALTQLDGTPGVLPTGFIVFLALAAAIALVAAAHPMMHKRARDARVRKWGVEPDAVAGTAAGQAAGLGWLGRRLNAARPGRSEDAEKLAADARRRARFRRKVMDLVGARYAEQAEDIPEQATDWTRDSAGQRRELVAELTYYFWQSGAPAALDWLIQRRATTDSEVWRERGPAREARWAPRVMKLGLAFFAALAVFTLLPLLAVGGGGPALVVLILWITAFLSGWEAARVQVRSEWRRERQKQFRADSRVHADWSRHLRENRPDDTQMAAWLDLDQRHLLREMLHEHEMEHRDIVYSFFVLEAAPDCVRARVAGGPVRYSSYVVKLFVLTTSGVWMSTWHVDFTTGEHSGRSDVVFRYDSISCAMLESLGRRTGRGDSRAFPAGLDEGGRGAGKGGRRDAETWSDAPLPREALRLVLENQQYLDVLLEDYALLDSATETETPGQLRDLARETSGVSAGFRILAALATEGRKWFDQRRRHSCAVFLGEPRPLRGQPV